MFLSSSGENAKLPNMPGFVFVVQEAWFHCSDADLSVISSSGEAAMSVARLLVAMETAVSCGEVTGDR